MLGDEERDLLVHPHAHRLRLGEQDRHAHLELGRLERHGQAPAEARDQALLDAGDLLRVGVAGDDDLLVRLDQRVEQVEELLLRAALAAEELDVVDEQQVERAIVPLELVERLVLVRAHHVATRRSRRGCSGCLRRRVGREDVVADRLDQVGLAEPHAAVDEKRVVRSRVVGHLQAGGPGELVGLAGHEAREVEGRIEARCLALPGRGDGAPQGRRAAGSPRARGSYPQARAGSARRARRGRPGRGRRGGGGAVGDGVFDADRAARRLGAPAARSARRSARAPTAARSGWAQSASARRRRPGRPAAGSTSRIAGA